MPVDIPKRRADRLRVMNAIFDASGGSQTVLVRTEPFVLQLGLSEQDLADACNFLIGEGLIIVAAAFEESPLPVIVQITHPGIQEMEQSLCAPEQATEHFPPAISIINVRGNVIGSSLQSGSPGAQQTTSMADASDSRDNQGA